MINQKCEHCCGTDRLRYNETVRDRRTRIAKIMTVCGRCYEKITGAS